MERIQLIITDDELVKLEQYGKENGCVHPSGVVNKTAAFKRLIADAELKEKQNA